MRQRLFLCLMRSCPSCNLVCAVAVYACATQHLNGPAPTALIGWIRAGSGPCVTQSKLKCLYCMEYKCVADSKQSGIPSNATHCSSYFDSTGQRLARSLQYRCFRLLQNDSYFIIFAMLIPRLRLKRCVVDPNVISGSRQQGWLAKRKTGK